MSFYKIITGYRVSNKAFHWLLCQNRGVSLANESKQNLILKGILKAFDLVCWSLVKVYDK